MPRVIRDRIARTLSHDEVPWVRPGELAGVFLPRPVIVVNGAFDLLHSGHMKIIFHARRQGKTVIVAMDSDRKVRASKGPGRPIQTFIERATTMNYMPVDYVVEIDNDQDMARLFETIRPDLRVQGGDYQNQSSRFPTVPKIFVRGTGMRTSKIIERCQKLR